jgi:hypothetical protein
MPSNDKREALLEALQAVEHLGNSYLVDNIRQEIKDLENSNTSSLTSQTITER